MSQHDLSSLPASDETPKARLRRRLKAGVFTALVALSWATAMVSTAAPAQAAPARGVLSERVEQVRAAFVAPDDAAPTRMDPPASPWGNGWLNWSNGWNNWSNAWNNWTNWSNAWNNWSNAWNNWSNWRNAWGNV